MSIERFIPQVYGGSGSAENKNDKDQGHN